MGIYKYRHELVENNFYWRRRGVSSPTEIGCRAQQTVPHSTAAAKLRGELRMGCCDAMRSEARRSAAFVLWNVNLWSGSGVGAIIEGQCLHLHFPLLHRITSCTRSTAMTRARLHLRLLLLSVLMSSMVRITRLVTYPSFASPVRAVFECPYLLEATAGDAALFRIL